MDLLNLELMGWLVSVVSAIALGLGMLIVGSHCAQVGLRTYVAKRVLEDGVLFLIWLLGLAGGIGLLQGKAWSRPALELFCWTLMVLLVMSRDPPGCRMPPPRPLSELLPLTVQPSMVVTPKASKPPPEPLRS